MTGDDLRALSAAATPGPWHNGFPRVIAATGGEATDLAFSVKRPDDAELIAWLRNHADALADLIDAARALLADMEGVRVRQPERKGDLRRAIAALDQEAPA